MPSSTIPYIARYTFKFENIHSSSYIVLKGKSKVRLHHNKEAGTYDIISRYQETDEVRNAKSVRRRF